MKPIEQARADLNASEAKEEHAEFMNQTGKILVNAMKFKAVMKKRNLIRAKAKCPFCTDGYWHGVLAGPRQHLHMSCDGCAVLLME